MREGKGAIEIPLHQPPHFLRTDEVVVDRRGAEGVGAEKDAALHFGAQVRAAGMGEEDVSAFASRVVVVGGVRGRGGSFVAVPDAVVFRQVGGGFGGSEDVVGREGGFGCRERDVVDGVALVVKRVEGEGPGGPDYGVEFGDEIFNRNADAEFVGIAA